MKNDGSFEIEGIDGRRISVRRESILTETPTPEGDSQILLDNGETVLSSWPVNRVLEKMHEK